MLNYARLSRKPRLFQCFTGLTHQAFQKLMPTFNQAYEVHLQQQETQRKTPRQRQRGAGRKSALLTIEDKLLFILFYFRHYPIQEVLALLFGFGQSQANAWIHCLTPILNAGLGYQQQLPARKAIDLEQILLGCPGLEFIIDGTERPIRRPQHQDRQRAYYSGKKKRHTVKNIIIADKRTKKIKGLGQTQFGKTHDKAATDQEAYRFPPGSQLWKDTGFQGYEPEQVCTHQPKKKPRGGELTPAEKAQNQAISSQRIRVEHSIGGVKVFRIVRDVYRNQKRGFEDRVIETTCGLHNYRVDYPMAA